MPFVHSDKKAGDLIRSADWNAMGAEVVRLGIDKISRVGTESLDGPLTVRGALTVVPPTEGAALTVRGDLAVGTTNAGSAVRVLKRQEDGRELSHGALVLGTDAATSAALRLGYASTYSWLQGQGQQTLSLNPHGGNVGIGASAPGSTLSVNGNASIGAGYLAAAAPANGLIVQGNVGIGTSAPQARLHVGGGDLRLDGGQEILFADNGQIRSADNNHRILFRRAENKMELREHGDIVFSPGATAGNETAKLRMLSDGTFQFGNGSQLKADQGGSIELGGNNDTAGTGVPYIDFHFRGLKQDYNARIINDENGRLSVYAGMLYVGGRLLTQAGRQVKTATGKIDLTSQAWNDMPDMSLTVTTTGNPLLLLFKTGGVQTTGALNLRAQFRMLLGGAQVAYTRHEFHNGGWELRDVSLSWLATPGAGTHEVKVQWAAEGGVLSACWYGDNRTLIAVEL